MMDLMRLSEPLMIIVEPINEMDRPYVFCPISAMAVTITTNIAFVPAT